MKQKTSVLNISKQIFYQKGFTHHIVLSVYFSVKQQQQ